MRQKERIIALLDLISDDADEFLDYLFTLIKLAINKHWKGEEESGHE